MKLPLVFLTSLLLSVCCMAGGHKTSTDTLDAHRLFLLGDSLLQEGKYIEAISAYETAAPVYKQENFFDRYLTVQHQLSQALWRSGQFKKTREVCNQALLVGQKHLDERVQDIYASKFTNTLGIALFQTGLYDSSTSYLQQSIEITKKVFGEGHLNLVPIHNNLAIVFINKGRNQTALEYLFSSLDILKREAGVESTNLASLYEIIGIVRGEEGALSLSLEYLQKAREIFASVLGQTHPSIARIYTNLGVIYLQIGDYAEALEYYNNALRIQQTASNPDHMGVATSYQNIGTVHWKQEEYTLALQFYRKALSIRKKIHTKEHPQIAHVYSKIADVHLSKNEYDSAVNYINLALNIRSKTQTKQHAYVIDLYNTLVEAHLQAGNFNRSKKAIDLALNYNRIDTINPGFTKHLSVDNVLDKPLLLTTLKLKAEYLLSIYRVQKNLAVAENILEIYHSCDHLIGEIRRAYLKYGDKVTFGKTALEIYKRSIEICFELYRRSNNAAYLEDAFVFVQRAKSSALAERLSEKHGRQFAGIDKELIHFEELLKVDLSYYQTKINEMRIQKSGFDTVQMTSYKSRLFSTRRSLDSIRKSIETDYPAYFKLKHRRESMSAGKVQKNLKKGEVLLEYFDADTVIYVFGIDKHHVNRGVIKVDGSFRQLVSDLTKEDPNGKSLNAELAFSDYKVNAHAIYQKLLEPILLSFDMPVNKLIIAAPAQLQTLPWEILIEDEEGGNYTQLSYIFRKYAISYTYSASLLFNGRSKVGSKSGTVLAFAPSYQESHSYVNLNQTFRDELMPLKWNQPEVAAINTFFDGDTFVGSRATEQQFKEHAKDYQVLHLAMHALVNHEEPMHSKLVFAQNNDSIEDGMLHTYELFNMDIPAEMVVLSACNTGLGKLEEGEGVMSLARAFSYAGCPSVIMSHWNANDQSTAKLMTSFYQYLADGEAKHVALQKAKLDFLDNANELEAHPFYWGSFVVLGDTRSLTDPIGVLEHTLYLLLVLTIVISVYWTYRRRSH